MKFGNLDYLSLWFLEVFLVYFLLIYQLYFGLFQTMLLIMLFEIIFYYFYNALAHFCPNGPTNARWGSDQVSELASKSILFSL